MENHGPGILTYLSFFYSSRIVLSTIVCNYLNQEKRIGKGIKEVKGIVLIWDNIETQLDTMAYIAHSAMNLDVTVFCPNNSNLPLSQLVQLFSLKLMGADIYFTSSQNLMTDALNYATKSNLILIENKYTFQYSLLGAGTLANEMLSSKSDAKTLLLPVRVFDIGFPLIAGISFFAKMLKPSIKIVLCQLEEQTGLENPEEYKFYSTQGLFPNLNELGWKSRISPLLHIRNIFDKLDTNNTGILNKEDLVKVIHSINNTCNIELTQDVLNYSEFITQINREYFTTRKLALSNPISLAKYCSLPNLMSSHFVDKLITITEDEAAFAFLMLLQYTHTLGDGKGVLPFAALLSHKIDVKEDKVIGLISGGFVDVLDFQGLLDYSMGLMGNHFTINLMILDNTTSLATILDLLSSNNISVYDVTFDRTGRRKLYHVNVSIQCLSKFSQQQSVLSEKLKSDGYQFEIVSPIPESKLFAFPVVTNSIDLNQDNLPKKTGSLNSNITIPRKPRTIDDVTPESIIAAKNRIKHTVYQTPTYLDKFYSDICGCQVYLKFDNIQKTGSFKARGSSNFLLKCLEEHSERPKGLIAASAGNHAQGVALAASKVGLPCTIICPTYAPETKLSWTRQYGAEVLKVGSNLEEALEYAERLCKERDWLFVRPFNDVDIIEGQGTMGEEIFNAIPDIDTVLVNVGGGGMIAGIALYLKKLNPKIRIIGVQSALVAPLIDYKQSEVLDWIPPGQSTIADGVAVRVPGGVHSKILKDMVDEYVTVSENEIASTIVNLLSTSRTLSEGAGCLGLAALLHNKVKVRPEEKVCVVICGGNIDTTVLSQIYEYGLRSLGRILRMSITTSDAPGNLYKIISMASNFGLKVHEVHHNRGQGNINWSEVTISMSFYSNSFQHQVQFLNAVVNTLGRIPQIMGREFIKGLLINFIYIYLTIYV